MSSTAYNDIMAVTTQELIKKDIPDGLAKANALWFLMQGKRATSFNGGNGTFQFAVNLLENQSQGWIDGSTDVLNIQPSQNYVYGSLQYKKFQSTVSLTLNDFMNTEGDANKIASLALAKKASAASTFIRTVSQAIWGAGTSANMKFNGIQDVLLAGSGVSYAGINNTDYADWYPEIDSTTSVVSYYAINNIIGLISENLNQKPIQSELKTNYELDIMLSRSVIQTRYSSQLQTQQRWSNEEMLKSGFRNIEVNGIPWVIDANAPDNTLVILSSDSFNFGSLCGFGSSKKSGFDGTQILPNQPIQAGTSYHIGNLWCENRRVNGALTGLTN